MTATDRWTLTEGNIAELFELVPGKYYIEPDRTVSGLKVFTSAGPVKAAFGDVIVRDAGRWGVEHSVVEHGCGHACISADDVGVPEAGCAMAATCDRCPVHGDRPEAPHGCPSCDATDRVDFLREAGAAP